MASPNQPAVSRLDVERHRQALLTAAAEEFSRNPDLSMEDVAHAANLTRATLYRHFSNRQTLLKAIQTESLAHAEQTLTDCHLDEGTAMEAFMRAVAALSRQGMRFRIILTRTPEHSARFLTQRARVLAPLLDVVRRAQREGDIRADLSPEWILTALTSLLMAAVRGASDAKQSDTDIGDLVLRTLVDGISTADQAALE